MILQELWPAKEFYLDINVTHLHASLDTQCHMKTQLSNLQVVCAISPGMI
jgi:hypothetical protein